MDDTNYDIEEGGGNANESFERRLRLANTAAAIALMGAKLTQGNSSDSGSGASQDPSNGRGRSKKGGRSR